METFQPTLPVDIETRKQVLVHQAETGARRAVRKSKAFRFYDLSFTNRKKAEYEAFETLWSDHYRVDTVEWSNTVLNASGHFYFDSALSSRRALNNLISFAVALRRRDAQSVVDPGSNVLPFTPSYGHEGNPLKEGLVSDSVGGAREQLALSGQKRIFPLVFRSRSLSQTLAMEQFWDYHYPCRPIEFTDPVLDVEGEFWIDSNFKWRVEANNLVEYAFAIREV